MVQKLRRWWLRTGLSLAGVLFVLIVAAAVWFWPLKAGEYLDSPSGKYRANAYNVSHRMWNGSRVRTHIEISVEELSTGRTIWCVERYPQPSETLPDFTNRGERFIRWSPDSSTVIVPVGGGTELALLVPP